MKAENQRKEQEIIKKDKLLINILDKENALKLCLI